MLTIHDTRTEFDSRTCTTALLPVGAVEQHGKHLPFGTDIMLAEAVAKPIAEKLDAYLLPAVAISASIEHRKARGTVYLRAQTLAEIERKDSARADLKKALELDYNHKEAAALLHKLDVKR